MRAPLIFLLGAAGCSGDKGYSWESETDGDGLAATGIGGALSTLDTSMCAAAPEARRFHQAAWFNTLPEDGLLWLAGAGGGRPRHRAGDRGLRG